MGYRVQTTRRRDWSEVSAMEQVRIASLALDPRSNQPVVLLKPLEEEAGSGRLLPIWIGHPEATAILLALEGVETPRPMTHDLLLSLVRTLDNYVERVEITRVDEGTFYAAVILRGEESTRIVDARPSDSIALAIRAGAPIYVADEVMDEAAVPDESVAAVDEEEELNAFRNFLDHVDPADFSS
jgi:bifunctional DNase/RNase